jgi:hypothetical protein
MSLLVGQAQMSVYTAAAASTVYTLVVKADGLQLILKPLTEKVDGNISAVSVGSFDEPFACMVPFSVYTAATASIIEILALKDSGNHNMVQPNLILLTSWRFGLPIPNMLRLHLMLSQLYTYQS